MNEKVTTLFKRFSTLEWMAIGITLVMVVALLIMPFVAMPHLLTLYNKLGMALTGLTKAVVTKWFLLPVGLVLLVVLTVSLAPHDRLDIKQRRLAIVVVFLIALFSTGLFGYGAFLPIKKFSDKFSMPSMPTKKSLEFWK